MRAAGVAARVSLANRRRKLRLFMGAVRPDERTTVVDIGAADAGFAAEGGHGFTYNFFEELYPWPHRITAVSDRPLDRFAEVFPDVRRVVADGRELPFADGEFDAAFSNAVVEHVGPEPEQRRFVVELCRVAKRVFVSTPNRLFPLEVHTLVPFAHWLPRPAADRTFAALRRDDWEGVHLLTPRGLLGLFPEDADVRLVERGITLSALAERRRHV